MSKLETLFQSHAAAFETVQVTLYGKEETVQVLCLNLLWGQVLYRKSMPKLNSYLKKGESHPREHVTDEKEQENIRLTDKALEGYVMCSYIAMGLLELIVVRYSFLVPSLFFRYLRTPFKAIVSEATVMAYTQIYFSIVCS